jgi:peptidoglycan/LPS O-acetylase OafA/YrhL
VTTANAHRYAALDLMRGIAALAVVAFHVPIPKGSLSLVPRGYLAVDLFFALSGFVLAYAYGAELAQRGNVRRFMGQRLIRLYPLYLVALAFGALLNLSNLALDGKDALSYAHWGQGVAANLFFLPALPGTGDGNAALFPAVFPAWSLMWELIANLLFALLAPRLGNRLLSALMLAGLAATIALGVQAGTLNGGAEWPQFWIGGARVLWAFFAGVALFRISAAWPGRFRIPDWCLGLVLIADFLPRPDATGGWPYDIACAVIAFPLIVLLAARARTTARSRRIGHWLGDVSYAVYVLQAPLLMLMDKMAVRLAGARLSALPSAPMIAVAIVAVLLLASYASVRFDAPIRAWLRRALAARASALPARA